MDEFFAQIAPVLGYAIAGVVLYFLGQLGLKLKDSKVAIMENDIFSGGIQRLEWACLTAVKELLQTTVGELKEKASDGKLTKNDALEIKSEAVNKAKSFLGTKGLKLVAKSIKIKDKDIDDVFGATIEGIINDLKK